MNNDIITIEELRQTDWQVGAAKIGKLLPRVCKNRRLETIGIAFLAYVARKEDYMEYEDNEKVKRHIEQFIFHEGTREFLLDIAATYEKEILRCAQAFSLKTLKAICLFYEQRKGSYYLTPSLIELAQSLLDIHDEDVVVDLCAGTADFLVAGASRFPKTTFRGNEGSATFLIICHIRQYLVGNAFAVDGGKGACGTNEEKGSTKLFLQLLGIHESPAPTEVLTDRLQDIPVMYRNECERLVAALSAMPKDGKLVVIAYNSILFAVYGGMERLRREVTEAGLIEAVISLPEGILLPATKQPISILVCSHHNERIRMIDASLLGEREYRKVTLDRAHMASILAMYTEDTITSCTVTEEQLEQKKYSWLPAHYLMEGFYGFEGDFLKDIASHTIRGITLTKDMLAKYISQEPTSYCYLNLQHIQDGTIRGDMPYLQFQKKWKSALLEPGDLIVTRTSPFKAAIVPDMGPMKIIANGNIYIIRLKTVPYIPEYVMLYLKSPKGMEQLNHLAQGQLTASLSKSELGNIKIPAKPLAEQEEIVAHYKTLRAQLEAIRKEEQEINSKIDALLE